MPKMEEVQSSINLLARIAPEMFTPQAINQIYQIFFNKINKPTPKKPQSRINQIMQAFYKYQDAVINGVKIENNIQPELNHKINKMSDSQVQPKVTNFPSQKLTPETSEGIHNKQK